MIARNWANLLRLTHVMRKIGRQLYEREVQSILPMIARNHRAPEKLKNVKLSVEVDEDYIKAVATKS